MYEDHEEIELEQQSWKDRIFQILPQIFRWVFAIFLICGSTIYLALRPNDFTLFVQVLISVFLFLMAYWIGFTNEIKTAIKRANDKWLPQAESVIYRLLTLHNNVKRFTKATKNSCEDTEVELPELKTLENRALLIKLRTDCDAKTQRLIDISHQIEDAIEDWRRFIEANCDGEECTRIFYAIQQREESLRNDEIEQK